MTFGPQVRYLAKRTTRDGVTYASRGEADWVAGLQLRQLAGEISGLELQPAFRIELNGQWVCTVKADATWIEAGRRRWGDYKGVTGDTPVSRLKRRLVRACHGVEIEIFGPAARRKKRGKAQ